MIIVLIGIADKINGMQKGGKHEGLKCVFSVKSKDCYLGLKFLNKLKSTWSKEWNNVAVDKPTTEMRTKEDGMQLVVFFSERDINTTIKKQYVLLD